MSRTTFAMVGVLAGFTLVAPQDVAAQTSGGWWDWALREVAGERLGDRAPAILDRATDRRDRDRDGADRDGRTLGDVIFGRGGAADDRDDRDDDDWDDDDRDDRARDDDRRDRADSRESRRGRSRADRRGGDDDRAGPPFCRNGQGHPVHGRQWCRDKGYGNGGVLSRTSAGWEDRRWEDIILRAPRDTDRRKRTVDQGGLLDVLGDEVFGRLDSERRRLGAQAPLEGRWLDLRNGGRALQLRSGTVPVAELTDLNGDGRVEITLVRRR
jgi:hypothetical protein